MATHWGAIAFFVVLGVAQLPGQQFDRFVGTFKRDSGARRVHVPFVGFASFLVSVGKPGGASEFKLALFERRDIDAARFSDLADATAKDEAWKPMIRVRSKDGGVTNIYEQQDGKKFSLLIATLSDDNATFVHVRMDAKALAKFIDQQSHRH